VRRRWTCCIIAPRSRTAISYLDWESPVESVVNDERDLLLAADDMPGGPVMSPLSPRDDLEVLGMTRSPSHGDDEPFLRRSFGPAVCANSRRSVSIQARGRRNEGRIMV